MIKAYMTALVIFVAVLVVVIPMTLAVSFFVGQALNCPSGTAWDMRGNRFPSSSNPATEVGCFDKETRDLVPFNYSPEFFAETLGMAMGVDLVIAVSLAIVLLMLV